MAPSGELIERHVWRDLEMNLPPVRVYIRPAAADRCVIRKRARTRRPFAAGMMLLREEDYLSHRESGRHYSVRSFATISTSVPDVNMCVCSAWLCPIAWWRLGKYRSPHFVRSTSNAGGRGATDRAHVSGGNRQKAGTGPATLPVASRGRNAAEGHFAFWTDSSYRAALMLA